MQNQKFRILKMDFTITIRKTVYKTIKKTVLPTSIKKYRRSQKQRWAGQSRRNWSQYSNKCSNKSYVPVTTSGTSDILEIDQEKSSVARPRIQVAVPTQDMDTGVMIKIVRLLGTPRKDWWAYLKRGVAGNEKTFKSENRLKLLTI